MTTAIVRERRDLALQSVECGAVMAEMARRAHFTPPSEWLQISCTALLIGNTFETSFHDHTYGVQKKRGKKIKRWKNAFQAMTKCIELTLDLTNVFFNLLFFRPRINQKCAEFNLKQPKDYKSNSPLNTVRRSNNFSSDGVQLQPPMQ